MSVYVNALGGMLGAVLKTGSRGNEVRILQSKLVRLGFNIKPDGAYGPGTQSAVVVVQQQANITADGVAGPQTMAAIDAAIASDDALASSGKSSRATARKSARERARLRLIGDAEQARKDKEFAAMRAAAMARGPVARSGGTLRTDFEAAHAAQQQNRASPAAAIAGAKSKLPWVIGGVAVLGAGALLLRRRK